MNYLEKQELKKAKNLIKYHKQWPVLSQRKLALIFHWDLKKINKILKRYGNHIQKEKSTSTNRI